MEFLKRKWGMVIAILFLCHSTTLVAQKTELIQEAFEESYTYEYAGELPKAIESVKNVYKADSYEINLRLGWLHYSSGLFTESSAYYQKAVKILPYSIEAQLGLVLPISALGNWDKVITQYKEILKIDIKNSLVNYRIGLIYYGKEDYQTAYKYFETVVNLYPFDYDSVIMFAWTNYRMGRLKEAQVLFKKTLLIRPNNISAQEGLEMID